MRRKSWLVAGVAAVVVLVGGSAALAGTAAPGADGVGDPYFPQDGNGGYDVQRYDVTVDLDPARPESFAGDTTVHAVATQDLSRFDLDLEGFTVTAVTVDGLPAKAFGRSGAHELVITPANAVHRGAPFTVRVRYSGRPVGEGWRQLNGGGVDVADEPHSASSWFPVDDHPSDKAALHLTATVPAKWTVVGNGLPGPTTDHGATKTYRWNEDHPIVPYATTLAVDTFTVHTSKLPDGTPLINAYGTGTTIDPGAEAQLPDILAFLTKEFGPYPFDSAGSIVVDVAAGGGPIGLETQTRPTYDGLFFDASAVHELAHQWFGDSVSFHDWRDGCLAECFAQYAGFLWGERQGDDVDATYSQIVDENRNDPAFWSVPLYDPGAAQPLAGALYDRGPLMLHALRRTVGDGTFFAMLRAFLAAHRDGNASWPDFERFAARYSGRDLTGFFTAWAHSTVIPPDRYLRLPGR